MSQEKGRPLPKFGEWDVNNPASADGFTVIFAKARDEKKATGTAAGGATGQNFDNASRPHETTYHQRPPTTTFLGRKNVRRLYISPVATSNVTTNFFTSPYAPAYMENK
ncbi:hypothetical protein ACH5RR_011007 [Cinchona calisaya]|uniref:RIN4 pathogenic type III effector avirulence factor Avr cleavage site domain-containing protein n=1 Tax=Cinchona calisaya TaxID=153742 RepID=A0ABD3A3P1_9GENT